MSDPHMTHEPKHQHYLNFSSECENNETYFKCNNCHEGTTGIRWNFTLRTCKPASYSGALCHSCFVTVSGPINKMLDEEPQ